MFQKVQRKVQWTYIIRDIHNITCFGIRYHTLINTLFTSSITLSDYVSPGKRIADTKGRKYGIQKGIVHLLFASLKYIVMALPKCSVMFPIADPQACLK